MLPSTQLSHKRVYRLSPERLSYRQDQRNKTKSSIQQLADTKPYPAYISQCLQPPHTRASSPRHN